MSKDTAKQLASLTRRTRAELLALWKKWFRRPPPAHTPKDLLVCALAYRLQEQIHGALSRAMRRRLRRLATDTSVNGVHAPPAAPRIKPGTRLVREWRGETHAVTVMEKGFTYRGAHFKSLSEIARRITRTRWSGPLFFGLKPARVDKPERVHAG